MLPFSLLKKIYVAKFIDPNIAINDTKRALMKIIDLTDVSSIWHAGF